MNKRILIVEDDVAFGTMLNTWFSKNSWDATWVSKVELAKQEFQNASFDLVLSDLRLPDGDGIILLTWMRENKIMSPFIIMTSYSDVQTAVLAMKLGAFDYLQKPINPTILQQKIELAMSASTAVEVKNETVKPKNKQKLEQNKVVKGSSAVMQRLYSHIDLVAPTKMSVLILGESGTGKEYIARMIHENSNRKSEPFVAVDCGSLSMELAPSELFGHKKGSFTSAISDKTGVFIDHHGRLSYLSLPFSGTPHSNGYIFPFLLCLSLLFFSQLFVSLLRQPVCLFAFLFLGDGLDHCLLYNVMNLCS